MASRQGWPLYFAVQRTHLNGLVIDLNNLLNWGMMGARFAGFTMLAAVLLAGWATVPQAMQTADLIVVIHNLRSADGDVRIALWRGEDGFIEPDAALVTTARPAAPGRVYFKFKGLAPGRYAVASYHDENGNGEFDRTWVGLPDEGLGFSNGAWIKLGPPAFEEAAIELTPEPKVIVVSLRY